VCCRFRGRGLKPIGQPLRDLEVVSIGLDEVEALRLADLEGLYQEAGAERMAVSRATFARVLTRARAKVADALVNQRALVVRAAEVLEDEAEVPACPVHWGGRRRGRGCRCAGEPWRGEGRELDQEPAGAGTPPAATGATRK